MVKIHVVYFAFLAEHRPWETIIRGQMHDLGACGVLLEPEADLHVMLTDPLGFLREAAKDLIKSTLESHGVDVEKKVKIQVNSDNLYEFPGIYKVYTLAHAAEDAYILYMHSKGMVHHDDAGRNPIEVVNTTAVTSRWRRCVAALDRHPHIHKAGFAPSNVGTVWFNFFWVKASYVRRCSPPPFLTDNRWDYEDWLRSGCETILDSWSLDSNGTFPYNPYEATLAAMRHYELMISGKNILVDEEPAGSSTCEIALGSAGR